MTKIWTNSGDSHFLEPDDLWRSRLPNRLPVVNWEQVANRAITGQVGTENITRRRPRPRFRHKG